MLSAYFSRSSNKEQAAILPKSTQPKPGHFTRSDVQDILDAAQLEVGHRYANTPDLCNALQSQLHQGIDECNYQQFDPMQVLHNQLRGEWLIMDAYNKHRLGRAAYRYYRNVQRSEGSVDYKEEENIPDYLECFLLRSAITKRGFNVSAPPIYQLSGAVEDSQQLTDNSAAPHPPNSRATPPSEETLPSESRSSSEEVACVELPSKQKAGRGAESYDKLSDAPPANLGFPNGNILMTEMAAFLPQSFKSWDIIDRTIYNGATSTTIAGLINRFRVMPHGKIESNSVYRMMKCQIVKRAEEDTKYTGWSVSKHQDIEKPKGFAPSSVSVTGFRAPTVYYKSHRAAAAAENKIVTVPFKDLAEGVAVMPSGDDALDLTRCVKHALAHPDEDWNYPVDFQRLLEHITPATGCYVGPEPVRVVHHDASIVKRLTPPAKLLNSMRAFAQKRDAQKRLLKQSQSDLNEGKSSTNNDPSNDSDTDIDQEVPIQKRSKRKRKSTATHSDEDESPPASRPNKRAKSSHRDISQKNPVRAKAYPSRRRAEVTEDMDVDSDDDDAYQGPKTRRKIIAPTRTSGRRSRFSGNYNVEALFDIEDD